VGKKTGSRKETSIASERGKDTQPKGGWASKTKKGEIQKSGRERENIFRSRVGEPSRGRRSQLRSRLNMKEPIAGSGKRGGTGGGGFALIGGVSLGGSNPLKKKGDLNRMRGATAVQKKRREGGVNRKRGKKGNLYTNIGGELYIKKKRGARPRHGAGKRVVSERGRAA